MTRLGRRYLLAPLLMVLVLMLSMAPHGTMAAAGSGLRVSGAILVTDVSPGEVLTHTMSIGSTDGSAAMDISVQVGGAGQSLDGSYQVLTDAADTSAYSARQFITLDKSSFRVDPGHSQDVVATIRIPEDVGAGGRYAIINVSSQPTGGGPVGVATAVNIPIYLTIKDSQIVHEGKITELATGEVVSRQPIDILTTFQNTGNHHFKVGGQVTVSNAQGQVLEVISTLVAGSSVLPTQLRQMEATFIPLEELPVGTYSMQSQVMLEDGTVIDEANGSFEIDEPYTPPTPAASITLTPSDAATLQTSDGKISISFPKGSVVEQVKVAIQSYPSEQLPDPPLGSALGTTYFRVQGLSALLVKEASMTVKYSSADLSLAQGDASRLRLARWDEDQNEWSLLKTKVGQEVMALSTKTDRVGGVWAVMVAPPTGTNWVPIWGAVAGVIVIGLLVYLLVLRRKGH